MLPKVKNQGEWGIFNKYYQSLAKQEILAFNQEAISELIQGSRIRMRGKVKIEQQLQKSNQQQRKNQLLFLDLKSML